MKFWLAPKGLHVEPGDSRDAKPMAELHAKSFYAGWPVSDFLAYLTDSHRTPAYVAVDNKRRLAGFAVFRLGGDECELLSLAVDKKWRGKGVGGAIMRAAFEDLRMSPAKKMFLEVEDGNAPAIKLYKGLGFAEIGRRQGYYTKPDAPPATALVMSRALD